MRSYSVLTHTRHRNRRVPGVPGFAKRSFFNRGHGSVKRTGNDWLRSVSVGHPVMQGISSLSRARPIYGASSACDFRRAGLSWPPPAPLCRYVTSYQFAWPSLLVAGFPAEAACAVRLPCVEETFAEFCMK